MVSTFHERTSSRSNFRSGKKVGCLEINKQRKLIPLSVLIIIESKSIDTGKSDHKNKNY